jgi:hypothetical protein
VGLAPALQISLQAQQSVNDGFHLVGSWNSNDLEISNKINTQNMVKSHGFLEADPDQTKSDCFSKFVFVFIRKVSVQVFFYKQESGPPLDFLENRCLGRPSSQPLLKCPRALGPDPDLCSELEKMGYINKKIFGPLLSGL